MAEEATNPVQTAPEQAAPVQAVLEQAAFPQAAAAPEAPDTKRKGSPLLVVLTVLLVLVGIADLALWGLAGYYFLQGF